MTAAHNDLRANRARRAAEREEMRAEIGESSYGHVPKKLRSEVDPGDKVNVSDPDSQKLKAGNSAGFVQGYNAQASVDTCHDGAGLILGAHVTDHCSDRQQLQANAAELERTGHLERFAGEGGEERWRLTARGLPLADAVATRFLDGVDRPGS